MNNSAISLILSGVLLNSLAQLALKFGMRTVGYFEMSLVNAIPVTLKVLKSPALFFGFGCYFLSVICWMAAIARVDISYAYPMTSLGYVITAITGYYIFQENLSPMRIMGIGVILLGVYLVSRS
ncbi:SMR family transporter [Candidatus Nucleicultrix amoebiphila]|uniref:4-amino-4-deoxy-L-arabinose transferase n=1 Tax=Candidatus Nucleicultrix amoebiphila FS5 TaxID=1414854 RepID=A0A1W6N4L5_9PROT|nr:SMR family transporter [Candidatus Nucleicultrix amoebiphila]ARN84721.1 4-amino-4-deoxy-L-arabinose transferase [Candidatus Nucleicultrix amoebiphila FS5]